MDYKLKFSTQLLFCICGLFFSSSAVAQHELPAELAMPAAAQASSPIEVGETQAFALMDAEASGGEPQSVRQPQGSISGTVVDQDDIVRVSQRRLEGGEVRKVIVDHHADGDLSGAVRPLRGHLYGPPGWTEGGRGASALIIAMSTEERRVPAGAMLVAPTLPNSRSETRVKGFSRVPGMGDSGIPGEKLVQPQPRLGHW